MSKEVWLQSFVGGGRPPGLVNWWFTHPSTSPPTQEITVAQSTPHSTREQIAALRDQLKHRPGLPFLQILSQTLVEAACRHCNHRWRERLFTPWITLGLFLSQILSDDHSCDDAVDRFQKYRYDRGLPAVSPETTSYCAARQRLPSRSSGIWSAAPVERFIKRRNALGSFTGERARSPLDAR